MIDQAELKAAIERVSADANAGRQRGTCIVTYRADVSIILAAANFIASAKDATGGILAERQRQIDVEGYTLAHDDAHTSGEIAEAAADWAQRGQHPMSSSWAHNKRAHPRRRQLVVAGALILAEIERLDRAAALGRAIAKTEGEG